MKKNRERQKQAASRGQLPKFVGEDHIIMIRVRRLGSMTKLVSTWTGSWRAMSADKVHLDMTAALKEVFQQALTHREFEMVGIIDILEAEDGQVLTSRWTGLDSTREIVSSPRLRSFFEKTLKTLDTLRFECGFELKGSGITLETLDTLFYVWVSVERKWN